MSLGIFNPPTLTNEPIYQYVPGSCERDLLKKELTKQKNEQVEIPLIIGGQEIRTGKTEDVRSPHEHSRKLGTYHKAGREEIKMAIEAARKARVTWSQMPMEHRASIFLKAADLLATKYRYVLNAATMLGQSKNVMQAEIDSACELIDFWRFNVSYMNEIYQGQPPMSAKGMWNRVEYRPLEGFVFAITPFNFTAIGGNLPTAPAMLGNVVLWKPASTAMLSAYYVMKILKEAGLPDGVINMIPGRGSELGEIVLNHPDLSGIHFTGSTSVFNSMWKTVGENLSKNVYKNYPRIVGETGGKDFIVAHPDCDVTSLSVNMVRGSFEYQGQKCSAASRAYIPRTIWPEVKKQMVAMMEKIKMGDVCEFDTFMGAVIDKSSFDNIKNYIEFARNATDAQIVYGGKCDDSKGYFIAPTLIETSNPKFKLLEEEIFGPVMTVFVYDDNKLDETLKLVDETSPYALTGAIFARNREDIVKMGIALQNASGNFYINDKPTGAVVGQQPFGGARASGTNDKAGSALNLLRWVNARSIKETFVTFTDFDYPHMKEK